MRLDLGRRMPRRRSSQRVPGRHLRTPVDPGYLRDLFGRSARYYDPVNRLTSLGQVVLWRKEVARAARVEPSDRVLDAFSGPGGLSEQVLPLLQEEGHLVLADLSPVMLREARLRLRRRSTRERGHGGSPPRVDYVAGDLLRDDLGLHDFDVVMLGWGLRYVPDVGTAVQRVREFLRPRGRLVVLEFTKPRARNRSAPLHLYFRRVLPAIGSWLAADKELHEYMSASAAEFLDAQALADAVRCAGFRLESCRSHIGGIVTILAAVRDDGGEDDRGYLS